ncbi:MAG TPA: ADOP family duplicated permease [Blastocatellia bacterium]|nr:ADOP family duplicated permease [Blastocatellia bacterium]
MQALWQDLRYSMRSMRKQALLSAVVIATLTLGVGFTAGIFTLINATYLRARIDKDHSSFAQVYSVYTQDPTRPGQPGMTTLEDYLAFRDLAKSLGKLAAYTRIDASLGNDDSAETRAMLVTSNFFSLYDLERPIMGRLLEPEDCAEARPVVVLSDRLWRERFASDPQIIGKITHYNGQPVTVVGIAPEFAGMVDHAKAWFPYTLETYLKLGANLLKPGEAAWLNVEGRLNPGFSHKEAAAEFRLLASRQDRLHPGRNSTVIVTDGSYIQIPWLRDKAIWIVSLIIGILTILVLIICTNVATLLLARAAARRQEIAVRLALGASRLRLVRMLMTETLLLASIAGLASLYFTYHLPRALMNWLSDYGADNLYIDYSLAPDWRVFGYLMLVTLFAATLAGLAPAFQSLKVNLTDSLKGRQSTTAGGSRLRGLLIGAQVALSFVLLFGALLAVHSIQKMSRANPGFETRHVLITQMYPRDRSAEQRSWPARRRMLTGRLEALPGVQSVAYASRWLFAYPGTFDIQVPGQATRQASINWVSPNFFDTLGIPIVSGRAFGASDPSCGMGACPVVVSQKFAGEFWPNADPLGKTFRVFQNTIMEVVGVARDVLTQRFGAPDDPMIYAKWNPNAGPEVHQPFVRFSGDEATITRAVSGAIHGMAPEISVRVRTIQSDIDGSIEFIGRLGLLVTMLGALAVVLTVIGVFGVVSFAVAQRTREIGIRITLGAEKTHIYGAILGSSGRPVALGLLIGLGLTVAAASALAQIIRNGPLAVNVHEPINYAGAAFLLAIVALAAMLIPARRATKVDPMVALRCE